MRKIVASSRFAGVLATMLAVGIAAVHAQDSDADRERNLAAILAQQKDAVERLKRIFDDAQVLIGEYRRRGENQKADLLTKAVAIVTERKIQINTVAGAGNESEAMLGDLKTAMERMQHLLAKSPNRAEEVQELGQRVVDELERVLKILSGHDQVESLARREENLADARREARRLAGEQEDLRDRTRNAVERSKAEKSAEQAMRDIDRLLAMLDKLDRDSRRSMQEVESAQELAARLQAMLDQQRRLRSETAIRAGAANRLTPKLKRALAEMDAIAKAARKAETEAAQRIRNGLLAAELMRLARQQSRLAREMERRAAIEQAEESIGEEGELEDAKKALSKLDTANSAEMKKLLDALKAERETAPDSESAVQAGAIAKAIAAEKKTLAARDDTVRDQKSLRRELERAGSDAPTKARDLIRKATRSAAQAAEDLGAKLGDTMRTRAENTAAAARAARAAEKALREAEAAVQAEEARDARQAKQRAEARRAAAERAAKLAKELEETATRAETRESGLRNLVEEAERALKKATAELNASADAERGAASENAESEARKAAERTERARRELEAGLRQRGDLAQRQGKIAEELKHLADRRAQRKAAEAGSGSPSGDAQQETLEGAAQSALQAQQKLKKGDHKGAATEQQKTEQQLEQAVKQAQQAAREAAERSSRDLDQLRRDTERAAQRAGRAATEARKGAGNAKETDARARLKAAAERLQQAEEDVRRSLRKLSDARPKEAEADRAAAKEKADQARRRLEGVRESHRVGDARTREELKQVAKRQRDLEKRVRRLDEQLKRLNQKRGQQRLQDAQSAMQQAARRLEEGESDEAEQAQQRAQKSLEQADKELNEEERRYRNLRQYEMLFQLRMELQKFRREAQAHRETLQKIGTEVRKAGRVTRHINRTQLRPLRSKIKTLDRDVREKADAIEKERAVVYTYLLKGCSADLGEVESLLAGKEVGLIAQELMGDVVRRFEMAIHGLQRELQEREKENPEKPKGQQGGQQGGGKRPLVPADAEIRMILVMQRSLNEERENFFSNRPDIDERQLKESEKSRLRRLYHQQGSLAELFDTLRQNLLGNESEIRMPEDEESGEEENR